MQTVEILVGAHGSGKSTYANKALENDNVVIVSRDGIRAMLAGTNKKMVGSKTFERLVTQVQDAAVQSALYHNYDVVLDATNSHVQYTIKQMDACGRRARRMIDIKVVYMETPLEECLRRNSQREDSVPEEVVRRIHQKIAKEAAK